MGLLGLRQQEAVAIAMTGAVEVRMIAQSAFSVTIIGPHQHPFPSIAVIAQSPFSAKNCTTSMVVYGELWEFLVREDKKE